jgi:5-methylcytosine-specific restriction endonuclease McrA
VAETKLDGIDMPSVPYGYCHCACGEKTRTAERTRPEAGWVRDEPLRFIHGHQSRMPKPMRRIDPEKPKRCTACGEEKPSEQFNLTGRPRLDGSMGRKSACKDCQHTAEARWRAANGEHLRVRRRRYRDANRERISAYNREYHAANRDRINARIAAWYEQNRDHKTAQKQRWYRDNLDRERAKQRERALRNYRRKRAVELEQQREWYEANHELALAEAREFARARRQVDARQQREHGRRRYALRKGATLVESFTPEQLQQRLSMFAGCWVCGGAKEHVDHVKPLNKGGAHCLANLRPACASCNASKQDAWPFPTALYHAA